MNKSEFKKLILEAIEKDTFTKSIGGYYTADDPFLGLEDPSIFFANSLAELKDAFKYDAYRQTLVYKDLVFVNGTVGGGWEARTYKRFGGKLIMFESISMQLIIKDSTHDNKTFEKYIEELAGLTEHQVTHYLEA